jgi:hypothetical protein
MYAFATFLCRSRAAAFGASLLHFRCSAWPIVHLNDRSNPAPSLNEIPRVSTLRAFFVASKEIST